MKGRWLNSIVNGIGGRRNRGSLMHRQVGCKIIGEHIGVMDVETRKIVRCGNFRKRGLPSTFAIGMCL